ncbi:MAG: cytochrome c [Myxococcales bacterium]|nr:cytochrome c [Myxococcales bacterium]
MSWLFVLAIPCLASDTVTDGATHYAPCATCHGAAGEGAQWAEAPALAGLPASYLERQLLAYRSGQRGSHPDDPHGAGMRAMAEALPGDEAVRSVSAHIAAMPAQQPEPTLQTGDAERGRALYGLCATCHGADGAGSQAQGTPPLTAQQDWYLVRQLEAYRAGVRGADPADTYGSQMRAMVTTLGTPTAIADVVAYVQTLRSSSENRSSSEDASAR